MAATPPGRPRTVRRFEIAAAVVLALVLLAMLWDWNWLRGPIERRVSAATGRSFDIAGDLDVDLGLHPRVDVGRMVLGNVPGAKEPRMASVDHLAFRIDLLRWLRGRLVLSQVRVAHPDLLLEKDAKGRANWVFPAGEAEWPTIRQLDVSDGRVRYRNPRRRTDLDFEVRSGAPVKDARVAPLLLQGKGRYAGEPVSVEGKVESPLALKDPAKPYHIDLRARAGATRAHARGALVGPVAMQDFDLHFSLSGPNLALLHPLTGVVTPDTPPYSLDGQLGRSGRVWRYRDFTGRVGDSDLAGNATVDVSGEKPFLKADLVSRRLDFDDLAGFVGAPPQTAKGESASPEQQREAAKLHASPKVLPRREFHLDKLQAMDADVRLRAHRVNAPSLPIDDMDGHLLLEDGVVRLDPLDFGVAGGTLHSVVRLDARRAPIRGSAKIQARGLELPRLFPRAELTRGSAGRVGGTLDLSGRGNSVAALLATSDGDVGLIMGRGRISNLLLEYAGIDIAESLKFLLTEDRNVPIRCAFADFGVKDGLMQSRRLAFDTTDTVIYGEGQVSLREESLDLTLKPQPKDRSILSLRSPLLVGGTFKDPSFRPDLKRVTLRGIAAAVLGSLAPPAALLAVYEPGPGKDVACRPGT